MKKLLALLLALAMVFSLMLALTACDDSSYDDDDDEKSSNKKDDDEDEDDDKKKDDEDTDKDDTKDDEDTDKDDTKDDEDTDKDDTEDDEDEEPDTTSSIVGTWEGTIDMADLLNMVFEAQEMDFLSVKSFEARATIEFEKNGDYSITVNEKDLQKALDKVIPDWVDALVEYLEDNGVTEEDFEDEYDMSVQEYLEAYYEENLDLGSMSSKGEYELDGDELWMEVDGTFEIDLSKDELEFVGTDEDGEWTFMLLEGVVFERQ